MAGNGWATLLSEKSSQIEQETQGQRMCVTAEQFKMESWGL